ncbi:hypothetical protein LZC95_48925 [Pendulispora brunnea]|uniref:Uncharacterized protein n=1 Tax=Pendulispora brunnea TaxID=2905690 RepID=A0ABZ2KAG6_9BACT
MILANDRLDDQSAEKEGCRYFVVETQSARYASDSANQDFHGEYGGACWWLTLGGRPATDEEARVADRARTMRLLSALGAWFGGTFRRHLESLPKEAPRAEVAPTPKRRTKVAAASTTKAKASPKRGARRAKGA